MSRQTPPAVHRLRCIRAHARSRDPALIKAATCSRPSRGRRAIGRAELFSRFPFAISLCPTARCLADVPSTSSRERLRQRLAPGPSAAVPLEVQASSSRKPPPSLPKGESPRTSLLYNNQAPISSRWTQERCRRRDYSVWSDSRTQLALMRSA